MNLESLGEFGLIHRVKTLFQQGVPKGCVGIGDDCAVVPLDAGRRLLLTTDMLVEDIHFLRSGITARQLGAKSLAVNLSDIAAMGGVPHSAFLALGLPREIDGDWVEAYFSGLHALAESTKTALLGGDTTRSPGPVIINLTVAGTVPAERIRYRSAARPGDKVLVTGTLGDSSAGLLVLQSGGAASSADERLLARHLEPRAHLEEGQWLSSRPGVHAMLDVSDGIDSDVRHILEASSCGAEISLHGLPLSKDLRESAARHGWDPLELAACGGEDYCLLLTAAEDYAATLQAEFAARFGRPLYPMGTVTAAPGVLRYVNGEQEHTFRRKGYDHFAAHEPQG